MKAADRQALFDKLMEGAIEACGNQSVLLRLFVESCNADLDAIEPLIDGIIEREVAAGTQHEAR